MKNLIETYLPFSPLVENVECGVVVAAQYPDTELCREGYLIQGARLWLSRNPQPDEFVRLRTAELLRFIETATEVEVAASLIADVNTDDGFECVHPAVVRLAQKYSSLYSLDKIKEENIEKSPLIYRMVRTMAEFDCAMDGLLRNGIIDQRQNRVSAFKRWTEIAKLMQEKAVMSYSAYSFLDRLFWAKFMLRIPPWKETQIYLVAGKEEKIDYFEKIICPYFLFRKKRLDDNQLLFSQFSFLPPVMTRLVDGLSAKFSPDLQFSLYDFNGEELEENSWEEISYDEEARLDAVKDVLGTARIFNPLEEILKGLDNADVKAETKRLEAIAYPEGERYQHESSGDPDEEDRKEQELYKSLNPQDAVFSDDLFLKRPNRLIYYLGFNVPSDDHNLPLCPIEKIPGRKEISSWITKNFPEITLQPIVFRSQNYYQPYCGELYIQGTDEDIDRFVKIFGTEWEDSSGKSLDPRFTLFFKSYTPEEEEEEEE